MIKKTAMKLLSFLLAVSTLLGGYLAVQDLFFTTETIEDIEDTKASIYTEYSEGYIPLVYTEISEFKDFLNNNVGNIVKINSQISFDIVLPESKLAHEVCDFDEFLDVVRKKHLM